MDLVKALREIDDYIVEKHKVYEELLIEFNKYAGMVVTDENFERINHVIETMQKTYIELHPYFHYICARSETCQKKIAEYKAWYESMEAAGAHKVPVDSQEPLIKA